MCHCIHSRQSECVLQDFNLNELQNIYKAEAIKPLKKILKENSKELSALLVLIAAGSDQVEADPETLRQVQKLQQSYERKKAQIRNASYGGISGKRTKDRNLLSLELGAILD